MPRAPKPRKKRTLRLGAPEIHCFKTGDGVQLRLTRFPGGVRGPVILAPGFGTSSLAFLIDTIDTNLTEFLYAHGYDVWLVELRGRGLSTRPRLFSQASSSKMQRDSLILRSIRQ